MAIHDGTSQQAAQPQAATQAAFDAPLAATAAAPQSQAQQQKMNQTFSFHSNSGIFGTPIGRTPGTEVLVSLQEKLTEIYKQAKDSSFEFALFPLDKNNEQQLYFSALVVLGFVRGDRKNAAYHTLILEASNDDPGSIHQQVQNDMIEVIRVASDASDNELNKIAVEKLTQAFPGVQLFNADSMVVPRKFNLEDKTAVHNLALNAAMASTTELRKRTPGYSDLNMAGFARDSSLVVTPRFETSTVKNIDELPRRQDVKIVFGSQQVKQQNNQSLNSGDRSAALAEISGYIDLLWAPVNPVAQYGMMPVPGYQMPAQKYAANLIITNFFSPRLSTLAGVLLALTTVKAFSDQNNWYGAFRSNGVRSNMRDIGYLNIEANLGGDPNQPGSPVEISMDSYGAADLYRYLNQLIRPGLAISIDVPESGPESWLLSVLSVAASGSEHSGEAQRMIFNAAQTLTNGNFANFFPQGASMFDNVGNPVHLGYYESDKDTYRDIRDIDYVAVAALSRDLDSIKRWSDTWTATSVPLGKRMDTRQRFIRDLTGGKAVFTGKANRVTFSAAFIDALVKGCAAVGVTPRLDANGLGNVVVDRGTASFIDQALVGPAPTNFFSSGIVGGYTNSYAPNNFRTW